MRRFLLILGLGIAWSAGVQGVSVSDIDDRPAWRVKEIAFSGNKTFSDGTLREQMLTERRPWYAPWRAYPRFDPVTFKTDLERVKRYYEAQGYYEAGLTHDLVIDRSSGLVAIHIALAEGRPTTTDEIAIETPGGPSEEHTLRRLLPLEVGQIFEEVKYQNGEQTLRDYFLARGHAHVETERHAKVDRETDKVVVRYTVRPGPETRFGPTHIEGAKKVAADLVRRELTYKPGDQFSLEAIDDTRKAIVDLGLFRSVQLVPERGEGKPEVVPMRLRVEERSPQDLKIGVGYSTEDSVRGQVAWTHRNWLGDGRQLSVGLTLSTITRALDVSFQQPHFLSPRTRAGLRLTQAQEDEETYLLDISRFQSRLEHRFTPTVTGFAGLGIAYARLDEVAQATTAALGDVREKGILFGPSAGVIWDTTDDPFEPKAGGVVSLVAEQAAGDFSFFKLTSETKGYRSVGWETVLAGRLKIGIADALGDERDFPLFERFYAGGEKSVRGYGRRRLGPISAADDPLGGLSLVEGSIELRRPLWQALSGALFLDFGQVSTQSFDPAFGDLDYSVGFGLAYVTPVGPLRLDIGFPLDPPGDDAAWQLHFSIGQFF